MSVTLNAADPARLLAAFKKAIDDKKVVTWSYDRDGDFTHTPEQWKGKAWLRPKIRQGQLVMTFVASTRTVTSWELYAVYHGRFIEAMIAHCNSMFTEATAPARPTSEDYVQAA